MISSYTSYTFMYVILRFNLSPNSNNFQLPKIILSAPIFASLYDHACLHYTKLDSPSYALVIIDTYMCT